MEIVHILAVVIGGKAALKGVSPGAQVHPTPPILLMIPLPFY